MELASRVDLGIVGVYLLLMVAIGFAVSFFNKSDSDFFRGGNKLPWWLAGISLLMTSFSVYTFTGGASMVYRAPGVAFTCYLLNGCGYILGIWFLAKRWRRSRSTTIFSYLTERYSLATNQVFSCTSLVAIFFQCGIMLLALAKFVSVAMGTDLAMTIIVCGVVIAIYCLIGGLWAVVITDTLQFMVVFPCAIITSILAVNAIGGTGEFVAHLAESWKITVAGEYLSGKAWTFDYKFIFAYMVMTTFAAISGGAAQRYFSVKNETEARKVAMMTLILFLIAPFVWLVPPFCARYLGMGADLASVSRNLNMAAAEEATYVVFCLKYLPAGAIGIILAAMLSATMSTLSSNYNAYGAVITDDIIKRWILKNSSGKTMLLVGRIVTMLMGGIVVVIAILMSSHPGGVFQLMLDFSGVVIMPAGISIFFGLIYKRTPSWVAVVSYLTGLAFGVVTLVAKKAIVIGGYELISAPPTFAQQVFIFGTISALIYFVPGLFSKPAGAYKERLEKFFVKLNTPVSSDEVGDSDMTDAGSYLITGWTTVGMGALVALLFFLDLPMAGKLINLSIGALMTLFGLVLIWLCSSARKKRLAAQRTA
jgi:solute:Na+ symporter, SSS family